MKRPDLVAKKIARAARILSRCRAVDVKAPAWVRHLLLRPISKAARPVQDFLSWPISKAA